ncbi:MAG TPA: beta-ketoacyl-ACP synthase III [Candidatus Limnocylindrales bacterium]|nr:beta-ketoacyl-ACP synthase III [Candidatus Limnocylindrales bacterium]
MRGSTGGGSVRVEGWGMYVPPRILTNDDMARLVDTSDDWIRSRTGIRERRVAGPQETTASLAASAGRRALAVAGLDPADLDVIVVGTCTPDYALPATAVFVKEALGAAGAAAMDVAAVCSGFVYAYSAGHAYVASGMYRNALVIGAETLTRVMDYHDRGTCILFGDGAGAVLLQRSDEPEGGLLGLELTADPAGAYNIYQPAGGAASPASDSTVERRGHFVRMDGRETYRYATRTMASTVSTALERAGVAPDEVALFVPHQANVRIIESVAKGLGIGMERVYVNVDRYGNTSAASVPMALVEAVEAGRVKPGDVIVFVAFGAGYTSGACVVRWTADPAHGARARGIEPIVGLRRPNDWTADDPTPPELRAIFAAKEADGAKAADGAAATDESKAADGAEAAPTQGVEVVA